MKKTSFPSNDPNVAAKQVLDNFLGIDPNNGKVIPTTKTSATKKSKPKKK